MGRLVKLATSAATLKGRDSVQGHIAFRAAYA